MQQHSQPDTGLYGLGIDRGEKAEAMIEDAKLHPDKYAFDPVF
jgi:hypothetical protein